MPDLHALLMNAHHTEDKSALVELYTQAADGSETIKQESFFLTHAYIYALECDHSTASLLHSRLKEYGREE